MLLCFGLLGEILSALFSNVKISACSSFEQVLGKSPGQLWEANFIHLG